MGLLACAFDRSSMVNCGMSKPRTPEPPEKQCTKCEQVKPLSEFYFHSQNGRHRPDCKACVGKRSKAVFDADPDVKLASNARWRSAHPDKGREYTAAYRARDPEHVRELAREGLQRLRGKVFDHYGRQCACCGTGENLSIDHVNGDGRAHRIELSGYPNDTQVVFRWLVANDFPAGFQVLCRSCNTSKSDGDHCRLDHDVKDDAECRI